MHSALTAAILLVFSIFPIGGGYLFTQKSRIHSVGPVIRQNTGPIPLAHSRSLQGHNGGHGSYVLHNYPLYHTGSDAGTPCPSTPLQIPATSSVALQGQKALSKRKHANVPVHTQDGAHQQRHWQRAKTSRNWKRSRAQDMMSDSDKSEEEGSDKPYSDPYEDEISEGEDFAGKQLPSATTKTAQTPELSDVTGSGEIRDTKVTPLFDLDNLRHYLVLRVHKSLSQEGQDDLGMPAAVGEQPQEYCLSPFFPYKCGGKTGSVLPSLGYDHARYMGIKDNPEV
ncbi:Hypothetical predicted protein [Pelobates cultripes]|uniref:Uncharacterized protein n=1 Tax=Pelobates cultripes TaxID=61616 RepID=A0AAD1SD02_PELCU|nr:Hypothetical predicted protein [Pelobates cultripes]